MKLNRYKFTSAYSHTDRYRESFQLKIFASEDIDTAGLARDNREIKFHVYGIRQTANVSWEFLRIENKQIKTAQKDSFG